jgi:multiple sugar transport system permease protein/putative aldouronate transport system permease protein
VVADKTLKFRVTDAVIVAILFVVAFSCFLPLWYTLCLSLSAKASAAAGLVGLWPVGFNVVSYGQIMGDLKFFQAFWNSVVRVVLGTSISVVLTVMAAYPLSKGPREFPLGRPLMWILVFTMLFNGGLVPWYMTIRSYGLINNMWALVLGSSLGGFNVILVVNFIRNLPKELEEAAVVDGAGPWYTLVRIVVPVSVPVIATITLLTAVYHWNEFFQGLVLMSKSSNYPLQTYIQQMVMVIGSANLTEDQYKKLNEMSNQTLNAAKIFIAMIPVLLVYPFLQRYFINGITLGSVKE